MTHHNSIFATLVALIHQGENGTVSVSFNQPCVYWISHPSMGEGQKNNATAQERYSIPNLPEGDYTITARLPNGTEESHPVSLHPAKPVLAVTYEWQPVPHGYAVPSGLEIKMDMGGHNGTTVRIPPTWTLLIHGEQIEVSRYMTVQQINSRHGKYLVHNGKRLAGDLTVEQADLFHLQGHLDFGDLLEAQYL